MSSSESLTEGADDVSSPLSDVVTASDSFPVPDSSPTDSTEDGIESLSGSLASPTNPIDNQTYSVVSASANVMTTLKSSLGWLSWPSSQDNQHNQLGSSTPTGTGTSLCIFDINTYLRATVLFQARKYTCLKEPISNLVGDPNLCSEFLRNPKYFIIFGDEPSRA